MAVLDPNAWYMIIYSDVNYALSQGGSGPGAVHVRATNYTDTTQQWQVLQLNSTNYAAIRSRSLGPAYYLNIFPCTDSCLSPTYCALHASSDINTIPSNQEWSLQDIGSGLTKIANHDNGTQAYLDAFGGFYVGLNANLSSTSLGWTFSSVGQINDPAFSTTAAQSSTSTPSSPTSTSQHSPTTPAVSSPTSPPSKSSGSGLSTSAKAGIGVSIAILAIALIALCFFFFLRKRKSSHQTGSADTTFTPRHHYEKGGMVQEVGEEGPRPELGGEGAQPRYELSGRPD